MLQQIAFALLTVACSYWAFLQFSKIRRNILLGKEEDLTDQSGKRWRNVFLVAFGQQKMFKRWIPAVFHLAIYVAFIFTQIELLEIFIDGFFGKHRFFAPFLGSLYPIIISTIEILSLFAFVATFVFLSRRNLLKVPRFVKPEMNGWPKIDGNLILIGELVLLFAIFCMNGADVVLQSVDPSHYHDPGYFAITEWAGPMAFGWMGEGLLKFTERFGWWLHLITVFAFLNYLPSSKHLHIILAFPNTYYARLTPAGQMNNMPEVMNEVKSMMGLSDDPEAEMGTEEELPEFGANDVFSLSWKNIMDAYTCTECGRCTSVCPANSTGKKLSPRKILMDIRDRATEIGQNIDTGHPKYIKEEFRGKQNLSPENYADGKNLFDYISREEIHACTTCNACVEACPVLINPLDPILRLRRYEILTESAGPQDWLPMFNSIENSGSAWQIPDARDKWATDAEQLM